MHAPDLSRIHQAEEGARYDARVRRMEMGCGVEETPYAPLPKDPRFTPHYLKWLAHMKQTAFTKLTFMSSEECSQAAEKWVTPTSPTL